MKGKRNKVYIILVLLIICLCGWWYYSHNTFSRQSWNGADESGRAGLSKSFLKTVYYEGMTVDEVKSYLGESDKEPFIQDTIQYIIGLNFIDYIVLSFNVDKEGKTSTPRIWSTS